MHDAVVADIPVDELDWAPSAIVECLQTEINGIDCRWSTANLLLTGSQRDTKEAV
jgi:hypothetical protein